MALNITLPLGKDDSIKNLIFTILTREYPLKLIELTNLIKKRYGRSVTFQAVRKAVLELVAAKVLIQDGKSFAISKEWVLESKRFMDKLATNLLSQKKSMPANIDSINQEITVFTFQSCNEMMQFWQQIIDDWYANLKHYKAKGITYNCWQGAHAWEELLHPDRERQLMGKLVKRGVKSYVLCNSATLLDQYALKFYESIGVKTAINPHHTDFDKEYYFGTYGDIVIQVHYPKKVVDELEKVFRETKGFDKLDLKHLSDIVNQKIQVKLSVIKSESMAKQMNQSILSQFPQNLKKQR